MNANLPNNSDQRQLLAAAQVGDELAFRRLVEPYRHALEVHCYSCESETAAAPPIPE